MVGVFNKHHNYPLILTIISLYIYIWCIYLYYTGWWLSYISYIYTILYEDQCYMKIITINSNSSYSQVVPVRRPPGTPCACTAHRCRPLQRSALRRFAWSRRSAGFCHGKIEVFMGKSWENVRKSSINGGLQLGKINENMILIFVFMRKSCNFAIFCNQKWWMVG